MTKLFLALTLLFSLPANSFAKKKVTVKYKSHTQFDFAGDKVSGKLKGAAVFYIFQRKRSKGRQVIEPPQSLAWHNSVHKNKMKEALK
jgi:hypothetical protein